VLMKQVVDLQVESDKMPEGIDQRIPIRHFLLLTVACLMFGSQGIAIKYFARQVGPIQLTFLPFCTATLLLIPLLILHRKRQQARPLTWADWRAFVIAGVAGQVIAQLCTVWGITLSLVSNAAIIGLLFPIVSSVLGALMLKERLTGLHIVVLVFGLTGAILLSLQSLREASLANTHYLVGNLLTLASLAAAAFYNAYCKGLFSRFAQIEVLVFSYVAGSLAGIPLLIWVDPLHVHIFSTFRLQSWLAFGYQALITYGGAMLIFFVALKHLRMTTVSVFLYLIPMFAVVLGVSVLGERLSSLALCGAALILVSNLAFVKFTRAR
jgi:drug/metabolite transporter (DMT)-like permease